MLVAKSIKTSTSIFSCASIQYLAVRPCIPDVGGWITELVLDLWSTLIYLHYITNWLCYCSFLILSSSDANIAALTSPHDPNNSLQQHCYSLRTVSTLIITEELILSFCFDFTGLN